MGSLITIYDKGTKRQNGFTLIGVMVTVAIVAILAAIALPSYDNYLTKVNRTAAIQFMVDVANRQEQHMLIQGNYEAISCTTTCTGSLGVRPGTAVATNYTVAAVLTGKDCLGNPVSGPSYVITATAIGLQVKDGSLCLDSLDNMTPAAKWNS